MRSLFQLLLIFGLPLSVAMPRAYALDVKAVRFGGEADKQRIVLELDKPAAYQSFTTREPNRIIIDLPEFTWSVKSIQKPASSNISDIRHGIVGGGKARIVLDTKDPAIIVSSFLLAAGGSQPDRLVIDFRHADKSTKSDNKTADKIPASEPPPVTQLASREGTLGTLVIKRAPDSVARSLPVPAHAKIQPAKVNPRDVLKAMTQNAIVTTPLDKAEPDLPPPEIVSKSVPEPLIESIPDSQPDPKTISSKSALKSGQKPLIIIDPGHGGRDPGAKAANGAYEKSIVLAVGLELKKTLEDSGRYRVRMTRATDIFIPLRERVNIAKRAGGDLFISLHADSMRNSDVSGASVYTLSNTASDKETEKLAERENKSDAIAGVNLKDQDNDVANILIDLVSRDTMNQSRYLANRVVDTFPRNGVDMLPRSPHRSAGFAVLKAMDIPSILVEMGYLTNLNEAQKLSSQSHRQRIANALKASVDSYFTKIAAQSFE